MSNAKPQFNLALLAESLDTKDLLNEDFVEMLTEAIQEEYGDLSEEQLNELFAGLRGLGSAVAGGISKAAGGLATRAATAVGNVAGRVAGAVGGAVKSAKFKYYEAEIKNMENKLGQMVQKLAKDYPAQQKFVGTELKNIEAALEAVLQTLAQPEQPAEAVNEAGEAPEGGGGDIPRGFSNALSDGGETGLLKLKKFSKYLTTLKPLEDPKDLKEAIGVTTAIINDLADHLEYFQKSFEMDNPESKAFFKNKNRWTALMNHLNNLTQIVVKLPQKQQYIQPAQAAVLVNLVEAVLNTYLRGMRNADH